MDELKGRPENVALDTSVENFLHIKMNCVRFFDSFDLSQVFSLSHLNCLVPLKVKLYVPLEAIYQVLGQGSIINAENNGSVHFGLKVLEIDACEVFDVQS
jgi:hypothetical protein